MSEPAPHSDDDTRPHEEPASVPFWKHPGLALVAALIALMGLVWRCA